MSVKVFPKNTKICCFFVDDVLQICIYLDLLQNKRNLIILTTNAVKYSFASSFLFFLFILFKTSVRHVRDTSRQQEYIFGRSCYIILLFLYLFFFCIGSYK